MNDFVIPEITISLRDLVSAVLLYLVCIGVVMVLSKYRDRLKTALWRKGTMYWFLTVICIAIFLPAIWETVKIITGGRGGLSNAPLRYVVLAAAITGPAFIIWRVYLAHYQDNSVQEDSIKDRLAKAMSHLGISESVKSGAKPAPESNLKVRLGAIYSIERVAQESLRDHVAVMEGLCKYIQNNSKADTAVLFSKGTTIGTAMPKEKIPSIPIDIQAAFDVIARRTETQLLKEISEKYTLNLSKCNLQRVNFRKGNFDLADMEDSHLDFAQMNEAELNGVVLNRATLDGADLTGARLNGVKLNGARLNEAKLDQAELNGAQCSGAEMNGVMLRLAKLNGAVLVGAKLRGADLNGAALNRAVANGADFGDAKLNGAVLKQAVLNRVILTGAELNGAELNGVALSRAKLIGTELNGAKLVGTDFSAVDIKYAAVKSTDLSGANRLSTEQIKSMFGDETTILPAQMKRPDGWPEDDLDYSEFYTRWQAAKKEAGLP